MDTASPAWTWSWFKTKYNDVTFVEFTFVRVVKFVSLFLPSWLVNICHFTFGYVLK